MKRWWTGIVICAVSVLSCDAFGTQPTLAITRGSPEYVPLQIGQSSTLVILIANNNAYAVDSVPVEVKPFLPFTPVIYSVALAPQAGCGTLIPETFFPGQYLSFIGPINPQQAIRCDFQVTRLVTSIDSTPMTFNVFDNEGIGPNRRHDGAGFYLGTFTDVAMSSTQSSFSIDANGIAHSVLQITATNKGPAGVGSIKLDACTDNFAPDFAIDGDYPGGCGRDTGAFCFDFGFGYTLPPLAAGATESCNLKLTSITPYTGPLEFPLLHIRQDMPDPATGGTLIDTNADDDWVDLFQVAPPPQPAPANSMLAQIVFAFAIIFATLIHPRGFRMPKSATGSARHRIHEWTTTTASPTSTTASAPSTPGFSAHSSMRAT